jgi:hypothetical protein
MFAKSVCLGVIIGSTPMLSAVENAPARVALFLPLGPKALLLLKIDGLGAAAPFPWTIGLSLEEILFFYHD